MHKVELIKQVRPPRVNAVYRAIGNIIVAFSMLVGSLSLLVYSGYRAGRAICVIIKDHTIDVDKETIIAMEGAVLLSKYNLPADQWTIGYEFCLRFYYDDDWRSCAVYVLESQLGKRLPGVEIVE